MKIQVLADSDAVARKAARLVVMKAAADTTARGHFVMGISGGQTPWQMLRAAADEPVRWRNLHVVQVDERVAAPGRNKDTVPN
jgi:6-phosphogluconolactonase